MELALKRIITPKYAQHLLTTFGSRSAKQIGRVCMEGVKGTTKTEQYVDMYFWKPCVTSKLVLHHLATMMKLKTSSKLRNG